MQKSCADKVQSKANAAGDEDQLRVFNIYASDQLPIVIYANELHVRFNETKRSTDWRKMLRPRAARKTPLKKAPSNLARCQPNENSLGTLPRFETWIRVSP